MAPNRTEFAALENLLSGIGLVLPTTEPPQNRTARPRELPRAALALTDDLISQSELSAASIMGCPSHAYQ